MIFTWIASILLLGSSPVYSIDPLSTANVIPNPYSARRGAVTPFHPVTRRYDKDAPDNCGFGQVTAANWRDDNIDAWFLQYAQTRAAGRNLTTALAQDFASNVAKSEIDCDVSRPCSPISCRLMDDVNQPDSLQAYFVLEAIANFNFLNVCTDGIQKAQGLANSFLDKWVDQFSYTSSLENVLGRRKLLLEQLQMAMGLTLAFAGIYGAVASAASAFIFNSIGEHLGNPPEKFDVAADLGAYIGNLSSASAAAIDDLGARLFAGQPDSNGNYLWQYLANGSYADTNKVQSSQIQDFLQKQYTAAGVNALWRSQRTYILAAPTKPGVACKDDIRGPGESKLCLKDIPNKVYYAYMIPPTPSDKNHYPQVLLPQGYKNLSYYQPLDLESAMTASVRAYNVAGCDYESVRQQRWLDSLKNSSTLGSASPLDLGYSFEGMFTIPVCSDPYGIFISAVKTDKKRRYPCSCWYGAVDQTTDFLYAAGLNQDKQWFGFCNDQSIGDACTDIRGEVNGKLDVQHENLTFGRCPDRNLGTRNSGWDSWRGSWYMVGFMGFWLVS